MWSSKPEGPALRIDDRRLVNRMQKGEEAAFEQFFEAFFHPVYRFALARMGQETELAKEIAQATLCTALAKLGTYRGEAALFTWLCSICRFEITGYFRRARRAPPEVHLLEEGTMLRAVLESLPDGLDDPEQDLLRRELARLVHVAIDHLPAHYARILEWKYSDGLSVKEIAARLGVTPKAAESLLTRARQAFRDGFASLARQREALAPGN